MKKMRYIPMLALSALLTGCNLFGGGMKAPTFAKEGEEVSKYSTFTQQFQEAYQNSEIYDTDAKLGDRILKSNSSQSSTEVLKRGKKEVRKTESTTIMKGEAQFDYDNLVGKMTSENKSTEKRSDEESSYSSTSTSKQEQYYQFNNKNLVLANAKTKEYRIYASSVSNKDSYFDNVVRSSLSSSIYVFSAYLPSSDSAAKDYLFYNNNDKVFTYSLNKEDEDSKSSTFYTTVTKTKLKVQIDLTDKKQAVRVSYENKVEYTYKKDSGSYVDGDVVTEEDKIYVEYTATGKELTVKEVNLNDYELINSSNVY